MPASPIYQVLAREKEGITEGLDMGLVQVAVEDAVVVEEETSSIEFIGFGFLLS